MWILSAPSALPDSYTTAEIRAEYGLIKVKYGS